MSIPDSMPKINSQIIAYHLFHEGAARDKWRTAYVSTHDNAAEFLPKCLPSGDKIKGFIRNILYHTFGLNTVEINE